MKTILKTIWVPIATMLLTAALSAPAAPDPAVPFRGSVQGVVQILGVQFPTLFAAGFDAGNATHLGRFAAAWEEEINLPTNSGIGSGQMVAANGDSIFYDFTGQGTPTGTPNQVSVVLLATLTGGTGRFAGASGSFVVELAVDLGAGLSAGSFEGTIVVPR
jgi:hypothetical protein